MPMSIGPQAARRVLGPVAAAALLAWERLESGVSYHPGSAATIENPYPTYERLRRTDPVHRMRLMDAWALTRHRDVDRLLRDHATFSSAVRTDVQRRTGLSSMLDMDPPDHTRLRSLVSQAFSPRAIERLRPRITQLADDLVEAAARRGRFDLMAALAFPLPVVVIAEMLGVPAEDLTRFESWSNDIALNVEPSLGEEQVQRVRNATVEITEYFEAIIRQRRAEPRDDLISALLAAEEDDDRLTHEEMISTLILLLAAGNETTRNLIGNGMLALLSNPGQLQLLRDNPDLLGPAIKEVLRYDPPVQLDGRVPTVDVEFGGRRIRAGQFVIGVIGAANRDPEVFEDPNTLDIRRSGTSHLSFGRGIHYCLGAPLAELEASIALRALLGRFPSLRLDSEPSHRPQTVLRSLRHLWLEAAA